MWNLSLDSLNLLSSSWWQERPWSLLFLPVIVTLTWSQRMIFPLKRIWFVIPRHWSLGWGTWSSPFLLQLLWILNWRSTKGPSWPFQAPTRYGRLTWTYFSLQYWVPLHVLTPILTPPPPPPLPIFLFHPLPLPFSPLHPPPHPQLLSLPLLLRPPRLKSLPLLIQIQLPSRQSPLLSSKLHPIHLPFSNPYSLVEFASFPFPLPNGRHLTMPLKGPWFYFTSVHWFGSCTWMFSFIKRIQLSLVEPLIEPSSPYP